MLYTLLGEVKLNPLDSTSIVYILPSVPKEAAEVRFRRGSVGMTRSLLEITLGVLSLLALLKIISRRKQITTQCILDSAQTEYLINIGIIQNAMKQLHEDIQKRVAIQNVDYRRSVTLQP